MFWKKKISLIFGFIFAFFAFFLLIFSTSFSAKQNNYFNNKNSEILKKNSIFLPVPPTRNVEVDPATINLQNPLLTFPTTDTSTNGAIDFTSSTIPQGVQLKYSKNNSWYNWEDITNGFSNVSNILTSTIFQDDQGNIWVNGVHHNLMMITAADLQAGNLDNFTDAHKGNITSGSYSNTSIFQDNQGNLWSMGDGHSLQMIIAADLQAGNFNWTDAHKGNITDGSGGFVFQDDQYNLWSVGYGTSLQFMSAADLQAGNFNWTDTHKGNVISGDGAFIFQDNQGNIWSGGNSTPLQMITAADLQAGNFNWTDAHKGNLNNGYYGKLFQDNQGNLWSASSGSHLQVIIASDLQAGNFNWNDQGSITDGGGLKIFQDNQGNIWAMATSHSLDMLSFTDLQSGNLNNWTSSHTGNISNGNYGAIFQDSEGNLWSMGHSKLQMMTFDSLTKKTFTWNDAQNSNITNGHAGDIFEDNLGNLWSMGEKTSLQVLKNNFFDNNNKTHDSLGVGTYSFKFHLKPGYAWKQGSTPPPPPVDVNLVKLIEVDPTTVTINNPTLTNPTTVGGSDGQINFTSSTIPQGVKLQFSSDGGTNWNDVPTNKIIPNLNAGTYKFQIVLELGHNWQQGSTPPNAPTDQVLNNPGEVDPQTVNITNPSLIFPTTIGGSDGKIQFTSSTIPQGVKLQFSSDGGTNWNDVLTNKIIPNLSAGTYQFQIVLEPGYAWKSGTSAPSKPANAVLNDPTEVNPATITINSPVLTHPTTSGGNDGQIDFSSSTLVSGVKLQFSSDGGTTWHDLLANKIIPNLSAGTYQFQIMLEPGHVWKSGTSTPTNPTNVVLNDPTEVDPSTILIASPTLSSPTTIGGNDGQINFTSSTIPQGINLQYSSDGGTNWNDSPANKIITNLSVGTYQFQIILKPGYIWKNGTSAPNNPANVILNDLIEIDPITILIVSPTLASPTTIGGSDGQIDFTSSTIPQGINLQYSSDGGTNWNDSPANKIITNLSTGTYQFQIILKPGYIWKNGTSAPTNPTNVTLNDPIEINPSNVTINSPQITTPTNINNNNGQINFSSSTIPQGVKLQYSFDSGATWNDLATNKIIDHLGIGTYQFQILLEAGYTWKNNLTPPTNPQNITLNVLIDSLSFILIPPTQTNPKTINGHDGQIDFSNSQVPLEGVKFQYSSDGGNNWSDINLNTKIINNLSAGTYQFQFILKSNYVWKSPTNPPTPPSNVTLSDPIEIDPTHVNIIAPTTINPTSTGGNNDGQINFSSSTIPQGVKLQYSFDGGNSWNDVATNKIIDNLSAGTYQFQIVLELGYIWKVNSTIPPNLSNVVLKMVIDPSSVNIKDPKTVNPIIEGGEFGIIDFSDSIFPTGIIFQYSLNNGLNHGPWKIMDLTTKKIYAKSGTYDFRILLDQGFIWKQNVNPPNVSFVKTLVDPIPLHVNDVSISKPTLVYPNLHRNNGSISFDEIKLHPEIKFQYSSDGGTTWESANKVNNNLGIGTYKFRFQLNEGYKWAKDIIPPTIKNVHLTNANLTPVKHVNKTYIALMVVFGIFGTSLLAFCGFLGLNIFKKIKRKILKKSNNK